MFYGIENWRAKSALAEHYEWLKSKGESLDPAQFDPPPVPDEDNAALVPVLQCFYKKDADGKRVWRNSDDSESAEETATLALWTQLTETYALLEEEAIESPSFNFEKLAGIIQTSFPNQSKNEPAQQTLLSRLEDEGKSAEIVTRHMAKFKPLLDGLRQAGERSDCVWPFPMNAKSVGGDGFKTISGLQKALLLDGKLALHNHDSITAHQDILAQARLASAAAAPPSVWGGLLDTVISNRFIDLVRISLGSRELNESQWLSISKMFDNPNVLQRLRKYLRGERVFRELIWNELPRDEWGIVTVNGTRPPWTHAFMLGPIGWKDRNRISANIFTQRLLDSLPENEGARLSEFISIPPPDSINPYAFLTETISYNRIFLHICRHLDYTQLAPVAIALKRYQIKHGAFPEDLTQVVPEFLPKLPLSYFNAMVPKYRRLPEGSFKLWFYGLDGDDDDGREQDQSKSSDETHDYDIVFTPGPAIP